MALTARRLHSMKQVMYEELRAPATPSAPSPEPAAPATRPLSPLQALSSDAVLDCWNAVVLPTLLECAETLRKATRQPIPAPPALTTGSDLAVVLDYIDDVTNLALRFIDARRGG